jgi:hypothetical protein
VQCIAAGRLIARSSLFENYAAAPVEFWCPQSCSAPDSPLMGLSGETSPLLTATRTVAELGALT